MEYKHNKKLVPAAKALRKNMTKEERHLWYDFLRDYPVRFNRQKILGRYIADFYCAKANLVIELDGSQHFDPKEIKKDAIRTAFLKEYGIMVLRIQNDEIFGNFDMICDYIDSLVKQRMAGNKGSLE
ncbi:MAG: endonuclease domain-containing protein [Clostridia bacterium]|nr:endonuclease domain-containing protein [Clostridia bacterium]